MAGISKTQNAKRSKGLKAAGAGKTQNAKRKKAVKVVGAGKEQNANSRSSLLLGLRENVARVKETLKSIPDHMLRARHAYKNWKIEDKKKQKYRSFRLQKRIRPTSEPIPSSWRLLKQTYTIISNNKLLFIGLTLLYGLAYFIFVRSVATPSINIDTLQSVVSQTLGNEAGATKQTATLLGAVLGSSRTEGTNSVVVTLLAVCAGIMFVWATRERMNNIQVRVRDVVFQSLGPILSVLSILVIISIQLIPFAIATYFYSTARVNSLFASGAEDLTFFTLTVFCGLLSFYWITSSIIALFITTLPGVYPIEALKASKKLVQFRRLSVFKKMLVLPLLLVGLYFLLLLIVLRFFPNLTYPFIDVYSICVVPVASIYLYKLYRALI